MKKLFTFTLLFLSVIALTAQIRLDVEGDAKILGNLELLKALGDSSLFIGVNAGINDDGNNKNLFIGKNAGKLTLSGGSNTFVGHDAGLSNTVGAHNTFLGRDAGLSNIDGFENTFLGREAGSSNTTGAANTFVGRLSGASNTTGTRNTFLGVAAGTNSDSVDRAMAIGFNAKVDCSNCAVIGGTGADSVNVGIGTADPQARLDVVGNTKIQGKLEIRQAIGDTLFSSDPRLDVIGDAAISGNVTATKFIGDGSMLTGIAGGSSAWTVSGANVYRDSGNVGIGIISPDQKLHVHKGSAGNVTANANSIAVFENNTDAYLSILHPATTESGIIFGNEFNNSSGSIIFNTANKGGFTFNNEGGLPRMVIDNNGNVGIGDTNPLSNLTLGNNSMFGTTLGLKNSSVGGNSWTMFSTGASNTEGVGKLLFHDGNADAVRMVIDNNGNVGIGTTAPLTDLHIKQSTFNTSTSGLRLESNATTDYWTIANFTNGGGAFKNLEFFYNGAFIGAIDAATGAYVDGVAFHDPNSNSDSRNSKIQTMDNVLNKVKRLKPSTKKLTQGRNAPKAWGFVAEEVAALFPEITPEIAGKKGIIYDYFGILAIKAIQEQQEIIERKGKATDELKAQLQNQENQINDQQQQINELKALVEKLLVQKEENPTVGNHELQLKKAPALNQNQPNPFYENTLVDYFIPADVKNAKIQVTAVDGKVIGIINIPEVGKGQVTIKASTYPSGTYYYSLILDGQIIETKQMVLTR